jgi:hypothetical protein
MRTVPLTTRDPRRLLDEGQIDWPSASSGGAGRPDGAGAGGGMAPSTTSACTTANTSA